MTQARSSLISLSDTPYYHCIRHLGDIFAIDVCAYSIMSNHYHLVLHANEVEIETCSNEDVCNRWYQLYSGSPIVSRWMKGELTTEAEIDVALAVIEKWRYRLVDISWFMRSLNEFIARKGNKEDNCKGRFYSLPSMALTLRAS